MYSLYSRALCASSDTTNASSRESERASRTTSRRCWRFNIQPRGSSTLTGLSGTGSAFGAVVVVAVVVVGLVSLCAGVLRSSFGFERHGPMIADWFWTTELLLRCCVTVVKQANERVACGLFDKSNAAVAKQSILTTCMQIESVVLSLFEIQANTQTTCNAANNVSITTMFKRERERERT
jgi:hypothetical protein